MPWVFSARAHALAQARSSPGPDTSGTGRPCGPAGWVAAEGPGSSPRVPSSARWLGTDCRPAAELLPLPPPPPPERPAVPTGRQRPGDGGELPLLRAPQHAGGERRAGASPGPGHRAALAALRPEPAAGAWRRPQSTSGAAAACGWISGPPGPRLPSEPLAPLPAPCSLSAAASEPAASPGETRRQPEPSPAAWV